MARICIFPRVEGSGGMASFRIKMERGLQERGIEVTHDPSQAVDALLLIAGTRHIWKMLAARRRGTRVVQRLDGLNWVQRARWSGVRYHLRAEYGNALMRWLRDRAATAVVYQSRFIRSWWTEWYAAAKLPEHVILNGTDLRAFTPEAGRNREAAAKRILVVEGSLAGAQSAGLFHAVRLAEALSRNRRVEVVVAARVDAATRRKAAQSEVPVHFLGVIPRAEIAALMRSADLLFSAEVNPPCPNSVIEALACGLPVVGFDTGSLRELVTGDAGRIAAYGANPWKLEQPDIASLAPLAGEILGNPAPFRRAARERAEAALGVDRMIEAYVGLLLEPQSAAA